MKIKPKGRLVRGEKPPFVLYENGREIAVSKDARALFAIRDNPKNASRHLRVYVLCADGQMMLTSYTN